MRTIIAAVTFGLVLNVAAASSPDDATPEGRAYFGFSFGGERVAPRDFHYGLRVDHDSRFVEGQVPPMVQLDFTSSGLSAARVNGVNVVRQQYRMQQAEDAAKPAEQPAEPPAEAPAEEAPAEEGFFTKMWHGITGFFGGGEEEETPAEETAKAEPAPGAEGAGGDDVTEGAFLNYNVIDWGLLAVGAVGLGYAVSEISNGDETSDKAVGGGGGGGGGGGACPPGQVPNPVPDPFNTLPDCIPAPGFAGSPSGGGTETTDPAYQQWLDSGTGHMGDLGS